MRYLIVGDYHAEPRDLDDCQALADFVCKIAQDTHSTVLFMGDQYHTHAIIHAEVQHFWYNFYKKLNTEAFGSISLVGNHDKPGSSNSNATAMLAHVEQSRVVDKPWVKDNQLLLPYFHSGEEFVSSCNRYSNETNTVFCHQTFDGAQYENGFYASDGIDPNLVPQKLIISGHVHKGHRFNKVVYVGSPRWRTLSDANIDRAIWLMEIEEGKIIKEIPYDTSKVCRAIYHFTDDEIKGTDFPNDWNSPNSDIHIDIYGSVTYIDKQSAFWREKGCRIRTFKTQEKQRNIKESDGLHVALGKWIDSFKASRGTSPDILRKILQERTGVMV